MSLRRRLSCLESGHILGAGCPECGLRPSEVFTGYEVIWDDHEDDDSLGYAEPKFCGTCGRQTTFIVGWADLEDLGGRPLASRGRVASYESL